MNSVRDFIEKAPLGTARVLQGLAAAESLTDDIAKKIYELAPIKGVSADLFVEVLHLANIVVPRNSEWHFIDNFRQELQLQEAPNTTYLSSVHQLLLDQGENGDHGLAGDRIPAYLFSNTGLAYHKAALGKVDESLILYSEIAKGILSGEQWLAGILAEEQQRIGILPESAIEPAFLRGMSLYSEKNFNSAERYLRRVTSSASSRPEVAISLHLVGVIEVRRKHLTEALLLFDRSITLSSELGIRHGLAMVLNSRGGVKRDLGDLDGALTDLNQAAELADNRTLASVLNSRASVKRELGNLEGALTDLNQAAELAEESTLAKILNSRATVKRDLRDLDGALIDLDKLRGMPNIQNFEIDRQRINSRHKALRVLRNKLSKVSSEAQRLKLWRDFLFVIAKSHLKNRQEAAQSIALFNSAMKLDVDHELYPGCLFGLGKAYFMQNKLDDAVRYFQEAINAGWESGVYAMLAHALTELGKPLEETRTLFERAIAENDENAWAKSWFALALSAAGQHAAAEYYARAAVAPPNNKHAVLLFNLVRVLDTTNDPAKQEEAIEIAKLSADLASPQFKQPEQFLRQRQVGGHAQASHGSSVD